MSKRKEWIYGIIINFSFILCIFLVDYYIGDKSLNKKFTELWVDSDRQEVLITDNKNEIDSTKLKVEQNKSDIDEIARLTADQYKKLRELNELQAFAKKELSNLQFKIDSLRGLSASLVVPFEKEIGSQDNYIRVFGRTGLEVENSIVMNSATDLGFDGQIKLGEPIIEQIGKSEFKAIVPSQEFEGLKLVGSESLPVRMKIPRNQISIGPMLGVTYDKITGLTEPIWGFGVSYNLIKIADWR
tara:strand:- start:880 stop:1608 length:729 start_codon:yes stop_codon:yes gene_type:complete